MIKPTVAASPTGWVLVDGVADWLMTEALAGTGGVEALVEGSCHRLSAAGLPIWRAYVAFQTLHPLFSAMTVTWRRDKGASTMRIGHDVPDESTGFHNSPVKHLQNARLPFLRRRLVGSEAQIDFPILAELREQGATDYLAYATPFSAEGNDGVFGSWATDRPGGFTEDELRALMRIQRRLGVACKVSILEETTRTILSTYLGPGAGRQVLKGQIKRGDHQTIHAAVWYSDLHGSTELAEALPPEEYLKVLNDYFECSAGAVIANGGEVLLLLGDAVLAIFPIERQARATRRACAAAVRAAGEAERRLAALNGKRLAAGESLLGFDLALHIGNLTFGNIGVPERLQFTVIGPAANEVARLHGLGRALKRSIVVSAAFARQLPIEWESLGSHALRGIAGEREVFAPPEVPPVSVRRVAQARV
ncbi:MAG: adenylate/guanylate cyclase domain-containing protein [Alphaproteobacteria bacterium]|nr:adenylate/guanylate cyclase domain-containing protein [Alphaproteobacteria bacterium]